jgi:hypothetical protein
VLSPHTTMEAMTDELHSDAVEGGNYDVIRERLIKQGAALRGAVDALDEARRASFGSTELAVLGEERVRTDNNCVPVDIVQVGGGLLFGYNVFLGLKREIGVADVLSLHTFAAQGHGFSIGPAGEEVSGFLRDPAFVQHFAQLYQYYKDARLIQLRVSETKLLAIFQIGATPKDVKVLRWAVEPGGRLAYLDDRGERDHVYPPSHDFTWVRTTRENHVRGRHPHVNVLDTVFVETVGGDLTIKVEDNTDDGLGIYREPVEDKNQSLDDADISYARLGALILLRVKPYREGAFRYLVFNVNTSQVVRIDTIGHSCVQLPEDHGILFPGGYYLRSGEYKLFDEQLEDIEFVRAIPAPNGEDLLYVFHRRSDGLYALYPYNLIRKSVASPVLAHGYSLFDDGTMVVFRTTPDLGRVHPVQVWRTPFMSPEAYAGAPNDGSLLARIGNRDLVRGISDAYTIARLVSNQTPTRAIYEELGLACQRFIDAYFWAGEASLGDLRALVDEVRRTSDLIVGEFEKVQALQRRAKEQLATLSAAHDALLTDIRTEYYRDVAEFLGAMTRLRHHRGLLISAKEVRYIDVAALDGLEAATVRRFDQVSSATVVFLSDESAFARLRASLDELLARVEAVQRAVELEQPAKDLAALTEGVNLLAEVVAALEVDDPTRKTVILDGISEVFAHSNRVRAVLEGRRKTLRGGEARAEFLAQFKLFAQSVTSALALCDTPEACDAQLSRLLLQLEELEGRFGDLDEFLAELAGKREEVYEAFGEKRQLLLDQRQRRVESLVTAAERILGGVQRRAGSFTSEDDLNAWFAGDAMVLKLRQLTEQLVALDATVKADEVQSKLKTAKQDALRGLRDKTELFSGGDGLIKLGKHRFTVNTQPVELTLVPRGDGLAFHLTGTDYYEPVESEAFEATRSYWAQTIVSEDASVYRGEYLAACVLHAAELGAGGLDVGKLERAALVEGELLAIVRAVAAERYDEGYDRGIHDADAARILGALLGLRTAAGLLRYPSAARVLAGLFWALSDDARKPAWVAQARTLVQLRSAIGVADEVERLCGHLEAALGAWHASAGFDPGGAWVASQGRLAARYLLEELARDPVRFHLSSEAVDLADAFRRWKEDHGGILAFHEVLRPLTAHPDRRFAVWVAWLETFARSSGDPAMVARAEVAREAALLRAFETELVRDTPMAGVQTQVSGLLGQHARVVDGVLQLRIDEFTARLQAFREQRVPGFRAYRALRQELLDQRRRALRLEEFKPRVMSTFVRNKLINDVYLPILGDNLAKQLGAAGEGKRTDLMGLLLLVSPPGYGKTTLMEYAASRLGLVFMKVNGPALGHDVVSIDPAQAPNATARQEVDKINLALEMGNNVMLYLDDIQHTNPELLQKFISLCDGQRRIEGVWKGQTRTYDLRGKKFCVVMAGNPYTESGDKFQIPDMLANRADTYNLGDVLGGREDAFALSFIENALTSNPALAPLATRSQDDVYKLVRRVRGEEIPLSELSHAYSAVEISEVEAVLRHMLACQAVMLLVNENYVRSAAMEDRYRAEPKFQLQGSYRNMNKLAEKLMPAMSAEEVDRLITDHYQSESQTLTTGAEANLLKLDELRRRLTPERNQRWEVIRDEFRRLQVIGGDDDPASKVTGAVSGVMRAVEQLRDGLVGQQAVPERLAALDVRLGAIGEALRSGEGAAERLAGVASALAAIEQALGRTSSPELSARLAAIDGSLKQISGGLAARGGLDASSFAPVSAGLADIAARIADAEVLGGVDSMLAELRAMRAALEGAGSARPSAPPPVTAPPGAKAVQPRSGAVQVRAHREALLQRAFDAIDGKASARGVDESELAASVGVIETLTATVVRAARERLSEEGYNDFVAEVKRSVAAGVGELAKRG